MKNNRLVKAIMLGICISALTTGVAFGQSVAGTTPSSYGEAQSEEANALYDKQKLIDQLLFAEYAKEIESKGILVNYTGVTDNYVEVGISPYTDENANYLYELLGKDEVKVVEFDESIIYATSGPAGAVDEATKDESVQTVKEEMQSAPDKSVSDSADVDSSVEDKAYKGGDVQIQIESTPEDAVTDDSEVIYYTTADTAEGAAEIQTVSATADNDAVNRGSDEADEGIPAPVIVLAIAGGAALVGGAIIASNKKKTDK